MYPRRVPASETFREANELDLRAYVAILRRRWRWVAITLVVALSLAILYSARQDPVYRATAKILIQTQSPASVLDGQVRTSAQDAERQLNNEIEILESDLARQAVR